MSEKITERIRPMGPLLPGDQAVVDALSQLPVESSSVTKGSGIAVVTDYVGGRETTPGEPKDHWSVASVETDADGNPVDAEVTLLTVSPKDINVVLRGGHDEVRTEEDKPKALDRKKLHDRDTEQSIKLLAAERLKKAAKTIIDIQNSGNSPT